MTYTEIGQILRKRGRYYQVIAPDLTDFLHDGGDYEFLYMEHVASGVKDPDYVQEGSGGNAWNWDVRGFHPKKKPWGKGAVMELRFQFEAQGSRGGPAPDPIVIDLPVFREVLQLLGDSRKVVERRKGFYQV